MAPADAPVSKVEELVEQLKDLHAGELILPEVIALGEPAIPALEALLRGPSEALYHSRRWAADALAGIPGHAATSALIRALRDSITRHPDPVSLEAEDVIINRIADHLAERAAPGAIEALLDALRVRPYSHCASALGRLIDPRAVPRLIDCLYDDVARAAAVDALGKYGERAAAALADVLLEPRSIEGREPPSSIDARAAAARLLSWLADQGVSSAQAERVLAVSLHDGERLVRVEAAIALARRPGRPSADVAKTLALALDEPHWVRAEQIAEALALLGAGAEEALIAVLLSPADDEASRRRLVRAIELMPRIGAASAASLLPRFSDASDAHVRFAAANALDELTGVAPDALARFVGDKVAAVRRRAVAALCRRSALDLDTAIRLLGDADRLVRKLAFDRLRASGRVALPRLKQTVRGFGTPLRTIRARSRLWWRAGVLVLLNSGH